MQRSDPSSQSAGMGPVEDVAARGIGRERRQDDPVGPGEEARSGKAFGPEHGVEMAGYGPFPDDRPMAVARVAAGTDSGRVVGVG